MLRRIRSDSPRAGILVITESLFALTSSAPDLRVLRDACRVYEATLLVDVTNDLGSMHDAGHGHLGRYGLMGEVDVVLGSLSRTFASNGGFVASNSAGLKQAMRVFAGPLTESNVVSPVQASIALAALDIVRSPEGARRRKRLASNVQHLRGQLVLRALSVLGEPSAMVPLLLGGVAEGRLTTREMLAHGALVELVEHPVVASTESRLLLRVMASHTKDQINRLVGVAVRAHEFVQTALSTTKRVACE